MTIAIRGMAPLLQVFDMPASIAFYRDVLGFAIIETSAPGDRFDWALLGYGGTELMLNTAYEGNARPAAPDPARVTAHRDTALFFGCADLDGAWAHLRAHGVDAEPPVTQGYGMRQVYLTDPDGYLLCLQWPATREAADAWAARYGFDPRI